jgi:hypothetical protein
MPSLPDPSSWSGHAGRRPSFPDRLPNYQQPCPALPDPAGLSTAALRLASPRCAMPRSA